jgi:hypothetical protein
MGRPALADMDGFKLKTPQAGWPLNTDREFWERRGFIDVDLEHDCFRLTPFGRERLIHSCATCAIWKPPVALDNAWGFCPERLKEYTLGAEICEDWRSKADQGEVAR